MDMSNNSINRICRIFGHLEFLEEQGVAFVSSKELAEAIGTTEYTIRKDISLLGMTGFTRKGYEVAALRKELGRKLNLDQKRKACIVGLGRLGSALLSYEKFQKDGFEIVAGFDVSINRIERILTPVELLPVSQMEDVIKSRGIELGIVTVPADSAQEVVDCLVRAGIKGILNFSPVKVVIPQNIIHMDMDFTSALRVIAARM